MAHRPPPLVPVDPADLGRPRSALGPAIVSAAGEGAGFEGTRRGSARAQVAGPQIRKLEATSSRKRESRSLPPSRGCRLS
jgi:hypothetical protein